jgi:cobalt-zinc-cadmium efflux system membrane fusion protein
MTLRSRLAILGLLAVVPIAAAEELIVDSSSLRDLGIEFARPATAGDVSTLTAQAYVTVPPDRESVIGSTQSGLVLRMRAATGDIVSAGQTLAEVQSPAFLTLQQEYLEAVQAAAVSTAQLDREEQLHAEGIIPARRLAETRARAVADTARVQEHRQMLRIAGMLAAEIDALASTLQLEETLLIRSPINGIVLDTLATSGRNVGPAEALYRVADVSRLWLDIRVPQERVAGVSAGMRVQIPRPDGNASAVVLAVGGAVDPETQTVSVRAEIEGDAHGLLPGQLLATSFLPPLPADSEDRALAVPVSAVVRSADRSYVFVRSENGVDVEPVTVVGRSGGSVYLRDADPEWQIAVAGVSALKSVWLATLDPDNR